ncbi:MAG: hypothetical protein ACRD3H_15225 [Terriglobales bacterium]
MKLSGLYTRPHTNLDPDLHLQESINWLKRAQDSGTDRGVSYGTRFGQKFQPSYPETTGYIICTFLELSRTLKIPEYLDRAIEMGLWEIAVQMESGAVMGGQVNRNPSPAVFNTGQVLLGWASLYRATGDERFARAGERACAWLMSVQEPSGHWIRGNSNYAAKGATLYNVKAAWGLGEMAQAIGSDEGVQAAVRNAEYTQAQQAENGWFPNCCLSDPERPLLHTIAYTMQGLMGIGLLSGRQDFIDSAARMADQLLRLMDGQGFIPGRINRSMAGTVSWCCLTGTAQTSIVWSQLYERTGQDKYREAVQRTNRYLMARHDIASPDPAIRGGLAGSWPVWGGYCPFMIPNWATKFFVDALLAEQRTTAPTTAGRINA